MPINNDKGAVIAYVLNFGDNDGYIVLSANKKNFPLIATSDKGHIDLESIKNTPAWNWIHGVANYEPTFEVPDSVSFKIARAWHEITSSLQPYDGLGSRSSGDPYVDSVIESAIAIWREQRYDVIAVKDADIESLPINMKKYIEDMFNRHNEFEINTSFILIKEDLDYVSVLPQIETLWNETFPYNAAIYRQYPLYPSVAAIAQIMYYHDFPKEFNLRALPLSLTTAEANDPLPQFMLKVWNLCGYSNDLVANDTIKLEDAALNALRKTSYGLRVRQFYGVDISKTLVNYGPVIMSHTFKNGNLNYPCQWICDGFRGGNMSEIYELARYTGDFAEINPSLAFGYTGTDIINYTITPSFHLHFSDDNVSGNYYGTDWQIKTMHGDQSFDPKFVNVIYDIHPL